MKQIYAFILLFISFHCISQTTSSTADYDLKKKRLLIQFGSMFLYAKNQGNIDGDSSVVLTCKAYKLPVYLSYDEGYDVKANLTGNDLIENGNINAYKKLLSKSKNDTQIKMLLQLGSFYLFKTGTKANDLQNAFTYINEALTKSNKHNDKKLQQQSLLLLGRYYAQISHFAESKRLFH